jgi:hypothetical protein
VTIGGKVYATEYDLPSGGMLDWANGDARIVEGLVNNYSLSFQTYDGSTASTALRLDGNNAATFAGTISSSGATISGAPTDTNGLLTVSNTYALGGIYYPAARFVNVRSNHSYGVVAEFRTDAVVGTDRPNILFTTDASSHTWQVGPGTSPSSVIDDFVIGYRGTSNDPDTFTAWGTPFLTLNHTTGNATFAGTIDSGALSVIGNIAVTGTVDGVDIATRDAVLTSTTTTATAALPLAGGTLTNTLYARKDNVTNYTDANIRLDSYGGSSTTVGIGFHISSSIGKYLNMNSTGVLKWNSSTIWDTSTLTTTNKTNYDSAYTYSQVGHLPLSGGTLTGILNLQYNTTSSEGLTFKNSTSGGKIQVGFQQNDTDGMHHRLYIKTWKGSTTASGNVDLIVRGSSGSTTSDVLSLRSGNASPTWRGQAIWNAGNLTNNSTNWNTAYGWGNHASGGYAPNTSLSNYVLKGGHTSLGSAWKTTFYSGGGGATFGANHYSMGKDVANGAWSSPNYSDLIIGYHTGIRIGAAYGGIRFYANSPTSDTNNTGHGNGGEQLLMTVGGTATTGGVYVNNDLYAGASVRTPIFYDKDDTSYYTNNAQTSRFSIAEIHSRLPLQNNVALSSTTTGGTVRIVMPGGGAHAQGASSATGGIKIVLPVGMTNGMLTIKGIVYEYDTNKSFEFCFGGYNYPSGLTWAHNAYGYIVTSPLNTKTYAIRFGYDSNSKACVYIGETNSTWSYPQVSITECTVGYSSVNADTWDNGWDVTFATTFENVTKTIAASDTKASVQRNAASYATIYYDNDNTAYYTDPASTSNVNALAVGGGLTLNASKLYFAGVNDNNHAFNYPGGTHVGETNGTQLRFYSYLNLYSSRGATSVMTLKYDKSVEFNGQIKVGAFANSQNNTGEAWIGRAADRSLGVLTVQLGGTATAKMEIVDSGWTTVEHSFDEDGISISAGSKRAPIFYDNDDTAFYIDPNHNTDAGRVKGHLEFGPNTGYSASLQVGGNAGGTAMATVCTSNGNLHIDAKTGHLLYLAWYNTGTTQVGGAIAALKYYDRNDTAFYVDPASSSILSTATIGGVQIGGAAGYAAYPRIRAGSTHIYMDPADGNNIYLGWYSGSSHTYSEGTANFQSYRDRSNSAYYVNPAGLSNLGGTNSTVLTVTKSSGANSIGSLFQNDTGNHSWGCIAEYRIAAAVGTDRPSIIFSTAFNSNTWSAGFGYTDDNFRIKIDHGHRNGGWGTAKMTMDRSGNVTFAGNVTAYSDERLKTDIKTIENPLDAIKQLRGVTFKWKESGDESIGLIAQEVEKVDLTKCLVSETAEDGNGDINPKNVAYGNMVGLLVEAVKELTAKVETLETKLSQKEK